jgi:hypothetical protein
VLSPLSGTLSFADVVRIVDASGELLFLSYGSVAHHHIDAGEAEPLSRKTRIRALRWLGPPLPSVRSRRQLKECPLGRGTPESIAYLKSRYARLWAFYFSHRWSNHKLPYLAVVFSCGAHVVRVITHYHQKMLFEAEATI